MEKERDVAKKMFRNKLVVTELDALMAVAKDAIGKMVGTSARFGRMSGDWTIIS